MFQKLKNLTNKGNSGNYTAFSPEFFNKQFGKTDNTINQIVHNNFFLAFLILVLIIQIISVFFGYAAEPKPIYTQTFFASVEVGADTGFDVNGTALMFGMVSPGSSSLRKLNFQNNYGFPVLIELVGEGDIVPFLSAGKVIVEKGSEREILVGVYAPPNSSYGVYSGNISVRMFRYIENSDNV